MDTQATPATRRLRRAAEAAGLIIRDWSRVDGDGAFQADHSDGEMILAVSPSTPNSRGRRHTLILLWDVDSDAPAQRATVAQALRHIERYRLAAKIERDHAEALAIDAYRTRRAETNASLAQFQAWCDRHHYAGLGSSWIERDHAEALAIESARQAPYTETECGCSNPYCQA